MLFLSENKSTPGGFQVVLAAPVFTETLYHMKTATSSFPRPLFMINLHCLITASLIVSGNWCDRQMRPGDITTGSTNSEAVLKRSIRGRRTRFLIRMDG